MSDITYDRFAVGVAQAELHYALDEPPDYLIALCSVSSELAMMVVQGMAGIISAFVWTAPFRADRIALLDKYKERWFSVSATALGVQYIDGQFLE
ncbi:hypothetical protein MF271_24055 (plasmid) [Deinococcus sp. KNUC1210]|uniref:hypothetical protein n=1 Tax=Deinococcus sp. KNUC1210 TaxID=2917691 RepID=UPI001EF0355E|nr:hypothetical protein [Deinococcus sp. KNUC1210]ULH18037.1 hypothetical protein MF271_24055 [Deinococcus sp. KNUC1210]